MLLVVIVIGLVVAVIPIIKITRKNEIYDDYERDFEERNRANFVNRFETDSFDFRHYD